MTKLVCPTCGREALFGHAPDCASKATPDRENTCVIEVVASIMTRSLSDAKVLLSVGKKFISIKMENGQRIDLLLTDEQAKTVANQLKKARG